jgi:Tfp pilus assembly protein PilF
MGSIQKRHRHGIILFCAALTLLFASISALLAIMAQEITIQVLDQKYAAVGAARIVIVTPGKPEVAAVTDRSGNAKVRNVTPGGHTLIVSLEGTEVYRDQFAVRDSVGMKSASLRVFINADKSHLQVETISVNDLKASAKSRKHYESALESIRSHDYPKAIQFLSQAIAIYPEYARAHNAKGVVLVLMDNLMKSESEFRDAIRCDSEFAEPHINLGRLLLESERFFEARDELQKAVDLKQEHVPAIELLIEVMLRIHDENAAVSLVRSLHSRGAEHPAQFHLKIASELERHTMIPLAMEQYSLVLQDQPSDDERSAAQHALEFIRRSN